MWSSILVWNDCRKSDKTISVGTASSACRKAQRTHHHVDGIPKVRDVDFDGLRDIDRDVEGVDDEQEDDEGPLAKLVHSESEEVVGNLRKAQRARRGRQVSSGGPATRARATEEYIRG